MAVYVMNYELEGAQKDMQWWEWMKQWTGKSGIFSRVQITHFSKDGQIFP